MSTGHRRPSSTAAPSRNGGDPAEQRDHFDPPAWAAIDLRPALAGELTAAAPAFGRRSDGANLFYRDKVGIVAGESESGKSNLVGQLALEVIQDGGRVVCIDFEEDEYAWSARMRNLGVAADVIVDNFAYVRPDGPLSDGPDRDALLDVLARRPQLVIIDGITEAMTLHGLSLLDNADIAKFIHLLPRMLQRATGAGVVMIDHVIKAKTSNDRRPIGGEHKVSGVDYVFSLARMAEFGRGVNGRSKLHVVKDRPGHVRQLADSTKTITCVMFESLTEQGAFRVVLQPPDADGPNGEFRPTKLMERASKFIESNPGTGKSGIANGINGNRSTVFSAINVLVEEGFVTVELAGAKQEHTSVKPYRENEDHGNEQ